jgi:uncharacterized protein (TIGR03083 family)
VRDIGAHLTGVTAYAAMLRGVPSPARSIDAITAWNAGNVERARHLDCTALAAEVDRAYADYLDEARRHPGSEPVAWHAGLELPAATVTAILAAEAYVHGWDIANALGVPCRLDGADMCTIFLGLLPLLPHYVDPQRARGVTASFDIRLRHDPPARAILMFDDGHLTTRRSSARRPDCRISADPATYVLVTYGRARPLTAALTGKVVATGRKPWLGLKLASLFRKP